MSDLQVARTKMLHLCLESHEQPGRLNLPRLPEGAGDVAFGAAVVLDRWANVPSTDAVGCHVVALSRYDMDDDAGSWWGKGDRVEIECAVEAGAG